MVENRLPGGAAYYAGLGWKILPCHGIVDGRCTCTRAHGEPKEVGKHPVLNQWNSASTSDIDTVTKWWGANPNYNVGVHCSKSGFFVIDIDPRSGGPDSFIEFQKLLPGGLPPTVEAITGTYTGAGGVGQRGRHIFYRCSPEEGLIGNLNNLGLEGVDIKHNGYVLINPSNHFSGVQYGWAPGHAPYEMDMAEAPEELLDILRKRAKRNSRSLTSGNWDNLEWEKFDISKMMKDGISEGSRATDIYKLACSLANKYGTDDDARRMIESDVLRFNAFKVSPPLETEELLHHLHNGIDFVADNPTKSNVPDNVAKWEKAQAEKIIAKREPSSELVVHRAVYPEISSEITVGELDDFVDSGASWGIGMAVRQSIENGNSISEATSLTNINVPQDTDALDERDGAVEGGRSLSDIGNGRRLVDSFGAGARYTTGLGWFVWKNGYWKPDREDLEISELAKRIAPIVSSEGVGLAESEKAKVLNWAILSRGSSRIRNAIDSAKSDPRVAVEVNDWDKDPNLLGVLNGVIDLKTGNLIKGRPDLHITRRAPVTYTQGHRNVRWEKFLDEATHGDKEYQEWLQKAAGYSLSGSNMYDIMFLVYGPSGTGKNTFVEALVKCLGTNEYAWPLDSSILAQGDGQSNSTDLYHWAQLRGRRMVWVDELPESERIKENAVKKLTGSSEISARSPGEQPFTFQSQAKLWISTNNRPIITDDAMWRRIRPIPFDFRPLELDPGLKEFIFDPEGGLPAVLSWAVEGAIKLFNSPEKDALGWCKRVKEAAEIYRQNEDRIGLFLSEEAEQVAGEEVHVKTLFSRYRNWTMDRGERPMGTLTFQRKLGDRGLTINGSGARAIIPGYRMVPRVNEGAGFDFASMADRAGF